MGKRPSPSFHGPNASYDIQGCDHVGCPHEGTYRAPKGRQQLKEYYWFCLAHVQAYNRQWDYYAHMSPQEIEQSRSLDSQWERETKPFHGKVHHFLSHFQESLHLILEKEASEPYAEERGMARLCPYGPHTPEGQALALFQLSYPFQEQALKKRYKELVKQFHPDLRGAESASEEKMKRINQAHDILKKMMVLNLHPSSFHKKR